MRFLSKQYSPAELKQVLSTIHVVLKMLRLRSLYSLFFMFLEVLCLRKQNVHVKNVQNALQSFLSEKYAAKRTLNA